MILPPGFRWPQLNSPPTKPTSRDEETTRADDGSPAGSGRGEVGEKPAAGSQGTGCKVTEEFVDDLAMLLVDRLNAVADRWRDEGYYRLEGGERASWHGSSPGPVGDIHEEMNRIRRSPRRAPS